MDHQFENAYALLIGVNESYVDDWALPGVEKDIAALAKVLTHPAYCAYIKSNIRTIIGQEATRQAILDGLEWLEGQILADTSGNSTAVVYYSGHSWRDESIVPPDYYLTPYDVREDRVRSRSLRATDFVEAIGNLDPRCLLVVLDCCRAGGMGAKNLSTPLVGYIRSAIPTQLLVREEGSRNQAGGESLDVPKQGTGRAVLSSSQGTQLSYMRRDGEMSIFTYHLIEALTGHAQPQEGATEVLVSDVMSYVWRRVPQSVRAEWGVAQEPAYQVSGNFPVALLLGGKGLRKGQAAPDPLEAVADRTEAPVQQRPSAEGGVHISGGRVEIGGDVVGRDKVVYGNIVHGDKVGGDKIG